MTNLNELQSKMDSAARKLGNTSGQAVEDSYREAYLKYRDANNSDPTRPFITNK